MSTSLNQEDPNLNTRMIFSTSFIIFHHLSTSFLSNLSFFWSFVYVFFFSGLRNSSLKPLEDTLLALQATTSLSKVIVSWMTTTTKKNANQNVMILSLMYIENTELHRARLTKKKNEFCYLRIHSSNNYSIYRYAT